MGGDSNVVFGVQSEAGEYKARSIAEDCVS